jgi:hypothetical protein
MIEFAVVKIALDDEGQLCDVSLPFSGLEDRSVPLSPVAERLTGTSGGERRSLLFPLRCSH